MMTEPANTSIDSIPDNQPNTDNQPKGFIHKSHFIEAVAGKTLHTEKKLLQLWRSRALRNTAALIVEARVKGIIPTIKPTEEE